MLPRRETGMKQRFSEEQIIQSLQEGVAAEWASI